MFNVVADPTWMGDRSVLAEEISVVTVFKRGFVALSLTLRVHAE